MAAEHQIRLRGGWEHQAEGPPPARCERVTLPLPLPWPTAWTGLCRLIRRFGAPPADPARERVWLRLENVPGLRRVWLNDRLLVDNTARAPVDQALEVNLSAALAERNLLVLEVEPEPTVCTGDAGARPWGTIALVIRKARV